MSLPMSNPTPSDATAPTPILDRPFLGMSLVEMTAHTQRAGFPAFRAKQVFHWLYQHGVDTWDAMTNLPGDYRDWLRAAAPIGGVTLVDTVAGSDGSRKLLYGLADGLRIEGVLMPEKGRWTLCLSSQAGCALGCRFCVTGSGGLLRNLSVDEILGQVLRSRPLIPAGETLTNVVFMGMGEPLLNLDAVLPALDLMISPQALQISSRRITLSTAGVIDGIHRLAREERLIKLAVSLNATDEETRRRIMPIARANPMDALLEACRDFQARSPKRHRVTFEYVLLAGVNDTPEDARRLVRLVSAIPCKINLIPFNPAPGLPFERPAPEVVEGFRDYLLDKNFAVAVRYSKGRDVSAACGQLALGKTDGDA